MTTEEQIAHQQFVKALQRDQIPCGAAGCSGLVEIVDLSQLHDRVKTFALTCRQCGWHQRLTGKASAIPSWDDASLLAMADEHLMHQQPSCSHDGTPIIFSSLPNPRRKARYQVSCFYCGRQAEIDWPPPESKQ